VYITNYLFTQDVKREIKLEPKTVILNVLHLKREANNLRRRRKVVNYFYWSSVGAITLYLKKRRRRRNYLLLLLLLIIKPKKIDSQTETLPLVVVVLVKITHKRVHKKMGRKSRSQANCITFYDFFSCFVTVLC